MNPTNLLDLPPKPIVVSRMFSIERLEQLFSDPALVLVRPSMWDDPFENFFLQCYAEDRGARISFESLRNNWYGQCWTRSAETDALWRIYSHPKAAGDPRDFQGVRISTTLDKLIAGLWDPADDFASLCYFIGAVSYRTRKQIESWLDEVTFRDISFGGQSDRFARTLLCKREAFAHEDEIRLLVWAHSDRAKARIDPHDARFFRVTVVPHTLIEEVMVDPRLDHAKAKLMIDRVRKTGFNGNVVQSSLYQFTPRAIRLT